MKQIKKRGSREQVWKGLALQTRGGLYRSDLEINENGKLISTKRRNFTQKLKILQHLKPNDIVEIERFKN